MRFQNVSNFVRQFSSVVLGALSCHVLVACHMTGPQVAEPKPTAVVLKGLTADQMPDGWQCNSSLPIGEITDQRNGFIMRKVGAFDAKEPGDVTFYLFAASRENAKCRFFIVGDEEIKRFYEPQMASSVVGGSMFSEIIGEMLISKRSVCPSRPNVGEIDLSPDPCLIKADESLWGSISQIWSNRSSGTHGENRDVETYLITNDGIINTKGEKM